MINRSNSSRGVGNTKPPCAKEKKQISPSKHWCFTLNNYEENDISSIRSNSSIKSYIFQEETGENGTPHLQGYIEFKTKCRPKTLFNERIHWEVCRNIKASIEYCHKGETRTGEIYTNLQLPREDKRLTHFTPNEWQTNLLIKLCEEPDDRKVIWIVDTEGGKGKSLFAKWLCSKDPGTSYTSTGKSADILTMIEAHHDKILIDLPRSYDITFTPYNAIEQIKNGFITDGKLKKKCRQVMFAPPHVVIFSNDPPDRTKLSADRWEIIYI